MTTLNSKSLNDKVVKAIGFVPQLKYKEKTTYYFQDEAAIRLSFDDKKWYFIYNQKVGVRSLAHLVDLLCEAHIEIGKKVFKVELNKLLK